MSDKAHTGGFRRAAAAAVVFPAFMLGAALLAPAPATNDPRTGIGDLICTLAEETTEATPGLEGTEPREMLCLFRHGDSGTEETYRGKLQMVGDAKAMKEKTLLWVVSVATDVKPVPGFLGQSYSSATETSPDSVAPLMIGDINSGISLKLMLERAKTDKNAPPVRVGSVELALTATGA